MGKLMGERKRCTNFGLEDGERVIRDPKEIREHVESYYKNIFGNEQVGSITLGENFWSEKGRLFHEEAQDLIRPFTLKGVEEAPGPDGLPVGFYRVLARN
jgi:hypothetical protein